MIHIKKREKNTQSCITNLCESVTKKLEIETIASNTSFSYNEIEKIYNHIFIDEHRFLDGRIERFFPNYDMSVSWQRLREGKNIQKHDIMLLKHELMELGLMEQGMVYETAHDITNTKYNYRQELDKYSKKED